MTDAKTGFRTAEAADPTPSEGDAAAATLALDRAAILAAEAKGRTLRTAFLASELRPLWMQMVHPTKPGRADDESSGSEALHPTT